MLELLLAITFSVFVFVYADKIGAILFDFLLRPLLVLYVIYASSAEEVMGAPLCRILLNDYFERELYSIRLVHERYILRGASLI